jgi:hypothetical protein
MRIGQRKIVALVGLLMSVLAAGLMTTPATAAPVNSGYGEQQAGGISPALVAAAPTTSPAAAQRFQVPAGWFEECPTGYVCATVPYGSGSYVFRFLHYATYTLYNWNGVGVVDNRQTGGAAARLLGSNGGQLICKTPPVRDTVNWGPIYYIQLTASTC